MKPLLIIFTVLAAFFTQPSFATEKEIVPSVLKSFQSSFSAAKDVEWTIGENMYKVRFELNGQVVNAYYTNNGNMLAVTRNITSHQLPLTLQANLKKEYAAFWITELFEINNEEGTSYYVTLETAENKVVLQSSFNSWLPYSKSKKE